MAPEAQDNELVQLRTQVDGLQRTVAELVATQRPAAARLDEGGGRPRFAELDVERINVVEPDGTRRVVISNNARFPAPVVEGKEGVRSGSPLAGVVFFNDEGNECGAVYGYGRSREDGTYTAGGGMSFDPYAPQDQIVGVQFHDEDGRRTAGLRVWEKNPSWRSLSQEEQDASLVGRPLPSRVFVGRTTEGTAVVRLCDAQGRVRLRLAVGPAGDAAIQFFDESGRTTYSLPDGPDAGRGNEPATGSTGRSDHPR